MKRPKIAVSACLLGKKVRYNGEDTKDQFVSDILPKYFVIIPFCPEVEMGMGIPREPVNLVRDGTIKMIGTITNTDYTLEAKRMAKIIADSLAGIDGIIFQKKSPSCGAEKVKLYRNGIPHRIGMGVFAEIFMKQYSDIPVLDSSQLKHHQSREQFIHQVFLRSKNA